MVFILSKFTCVVIQFFFLKIHLIYRRPFGWEFLVQRFILYCKKVDPVSAFSIISQSVEIFFLPQRDSNRNTLAVKTFLMKHLMLYFILYIKIGGVHCRPSVHVRQHEQPSVSHTYQAPAGGQRPVRNAFGARRSRRGG